jgi:hypothetical protein
MAAYSVPLSHTQPVELLEWGISPSQGLDLLTDNTGILNAYRHRASSGNDRNRLPVLDYCHDFQSYALQESESSQADERRELHLTNKGRIYTGYQLSSYGCLEG